MKTRVTPGQIAHYQRRGCVILEDFLAPVELMPLVTAVMETVDQFGPKRATRPMPTNAFSGRKLRIWRILIIFRYRRAPGHMPAVRNKGVASQTLTRRATW